MTEELFTRSSHSLILHGESFSIEVLAGKLDKLIQSISKQLGDDRRQVNEAIKIKGRRGTLVVPPPEAKKLLSEVKWYAESVV